MFEDRWYAIPQGESLVGGRTVARAAGGEHLHTRSGSAYW